LCGPRESSCSSGIIEELEITPTASAPYSRSIQTTENRFAENGKNVASGTCADTVGVVSDIIRC
jgi:hypothetical protein